MKKIDKNFGLKFIDEFILIINKITSKFINLNTKKLLKFIIELIVIIIFIRLLKIPFELIKQVAKGISYYVYPIIFINVWSILIEILYFFFALVTFVFIYNKKYPDPKLSKIEKKEYEVVFTNLYKIILILIITFPLFITLLILVVIFLFIVYLLFQGVTYFSLILLLIPLIFYNVIFLNKIYCYLKRKNYNNRIINVFKVINVFVFTLGLTLLSIEIMNTKFYKNELPPLDYPIKSDTLSTRIDTKMKIVCYGCEEKYEIIYDNSLNNEIVIEVSYYEQYVQSMFSTDRNLIMIKGRSLNKFSPEFKLSLLNDLKKKHIYNYSLLYDKQLTIWINENNIESLSVIIK